MKLYCLFFLIILCLIFPNSAFLQVELSPVDRMVKAVKLVYQDNRDAALSELEAAEAELRGQGNLLLADRCRTLLTILPKLEETSTLPLMSLPAGWKFIGEIKNETAVQHIYLHSSGENIHNTLFQGNTIDIRSLVERLKGGLSEAGLMFEESQFQGQDSYQLTYSVSPSRGKTSAIRIFYENNSTSMEFISDLEKAHPSQPGTQASTNLRSGGGSGGGGSRSSAQFTSSSWIIPVVIVVVLLGMAVAVFAVVLRSRNGKKTSSIKAKFEVFYHDGSQKTYEICTFRTSIGRAEDNNLILHDPDVSAHHAVLEASDDGFFFRDLKSTNKSLVNGKSVSGCLLFLDDEILMGSTRVILRN